MILSTAESQGRIEVQEALEFSKRLADGTALDSSAEKEKPASTALDSSAEKEKEKIWEVDSVDASTIELNFSSEDRSSFALFSQTLSLSLSPLFFGHFFQVSTAICSKDEPEVVEEKNQSHPKDPVQAEKEKSNKDPL